MGAEQRIRWIRRNRPVGALPFVTGAGGLPQGHKVLAFLPHSDDGRFIGATLALLNQRDGGGARNEVRIVIVCPGYRSVEGGAPSAEKAAVRWQEALRWAEVLGVGAAQMVNFDAVRTYERRCCDRGDRRRMDRLVAAERPTLVMLPHVSDVAQHANHNTRRLVLGAVVCWLAAACRKARRSREVLLVEYPTLHVPILPPADRNLIVLLDDPELALAKHRANEAHQSQRSKLFDMLGRFVEAVDALTGADDVLQATSGGLPRARDLAGICINPRESRGEHFGITRLIAEPTRRGAALREERLAFPLSAADFARWQRGPAGERAGGSESAPGSRGAR